MSVQTQIDRIDGNVKKALAKIAEKGVVVASDANSDDLESLIAAIESGGGGGNVIIGEIIPSDGMITIDLTEYGVEKDDANTPRARFLLEKTVEMTSHTKIRPIFVLQFSTDESSNAPANNRAFQNALIYSSSESSIIKFDTNNVVNMWNTSQSASGEHIHSVIVGQIKFNKAEMRIASPTSLYGPIAGRTYIWGVIL